MLRRMALVAIEVLVPGMAALADGIPAAEIAARCQVKKTNVTKMAYEDQNFTILMSNEGKSCVLAQWVNYTELGTPMGSKPYDSFSLRTAPVHGEVIYTIDNRSYVQYRPARGYVGDDSFEFRMLPGNALRTVTVTVGP